MLRIYYYKNIKTLKNRMLRVLCLFVYQGKDQYWMLSIEGRILRDNNCIGFKVNHRIIIFSIFKKCLFNEENLSFAIVYKIRIWRH